MMVNEGDISTQLLMMDGFEDAFIGAQIVYIGEGEFAARATYDYEKTVALMVAQDEISIEEAQDAVFTIIRDGMSNHTLPTFLTQNVEVQGAEYDS